MQGIESGFIQKKRQILSLLFGGTEQIKLLATVISLGRLVQHDDDDMKNRMNFTKIATYSSSAGD